MVWKKYLDTAIKTEGKEMVKAQNYSLQQQCNNETQLQTKVMHNIPKPASIEQRPSKTQNQTFTNPESIHF